MQIKTVYCEELTVNPAQRMNQFALPKQTEPWSRGGQASGRVEEGLIRILNIDYLVLVDSKDNCDYFKL